MSPLKLRQWDQQSDQQSPRSPTYSPSSVQSPLKLRLRDQYSDQQSSQSPTYSPWSFQSPTYSPVSLPPSPAAPSVHQAQSSLPSAFQPIIIAPATVARDPGGVNTVDSGGGSAADTGRQRLLTRIEQHFEETHRKDFQKASDHKKHAKHKKKHSKEKKKVRKHKRRSPKTAMNPYDDESDDYDVATDAQRPLTLKLKLNQGHPQVSKSQEYTGKVKIKRRLKKRPRDSDDYVLNQSNITAVPSQRKKSRFRPSEAAGSATSFSVPSQSATSSTHSTSAVGSVTSSSQQQHGVGQGAPAGAHSDANSRPVLQHSVSVTAPSPAKRILQHSRSAPGIRRSRGKAMWEGSDLDKSDDEVAKVQESSSDSDVIVVSHQPARHSNAIRTAPVGDASVRQVSISSGSDDQIQPNQNVVSGDNQNVTVNAAGSSVVVTSTSASAIDMNPKPAAASTSAASSSSLPVANPSQASTSTDTSRGSLLIPLKKRKLNHSASTSYIHPALSQAQALSLPTAVDASSGIPIDMSSSHSLPSSPLVTAGSDDTPMAGEIVAANCYVCGLTRGMDELSQCLNQHYCCGDCLQAQAQDIMLDKEVSVDNFQLTSNSLTSFISVYMY